MEATEMVTLQVEACVSFLFLGRDDCFIFFRLSLFFLGGGWGG